MRELIDLADRFFQHVIIHRHVNGGMRNIDPFLQQMLQLIITRGVNAVFSFAFYFMINDKKSDRKIPVPGEVEKIFDVGEEFQS